MREKEHNYLKLWKNSARRKPLLLRGARQVGKTTLIKQFAAASFSSSLYLNFETDKKLAAFFSPSLEPKDILKNLSLYFEKPIDPQECLLIFDEIQECPDALNSLKYFSENKSKQPIICAGSLLGVKLSEKGFPVGQVEFLDVFPLSFLDYLIVQGHEKLAQHLSEIKKAEPIPGPIHLRFLTLLKEYFFVGGMPEAVFQKAESPNDFNKIREVQKNILDAYQLDFAKHAPKDQVVRIGEVFNSIPIHLGKENKKFVFSAINKSARAREYSIALQWLKDARILLNTVQINQIDLPLVAHAHPGTFKVYLLDVGLLGAMVDLPAKLLVQQGDLFSSFKGALAENFVAQELTHHLHSKLYYWSSGGTAEVDFVVQGEGAPEAIEVKSGEVVRSVSLKMFAEKYQLKKVSRASLLNLKKDGITTNYPLYLLNQFPKL